jgi:ribosomal protein S8E
MKKSFKLKVQNLMKNKSKSILITQIKNNPKIQTYNRKMILSKMKIFMID